MRYLALATDYDGTLASEGRVPESTIRALESLRESGRRIIMVTGRELNDLRSVFDRFDLFDFVVAENGALLFQPSTQSETVLSETPPELFLENLKRNRVPFSIGKSIVATHTEFAEPVLRAIKESGVELQVVFNKGAAMVLPSGINKATGLRAALDRLRLDPHNVAAIGDAENDHALISSCEFGVAVGNAVDMLKQRADWVTDDARGKGVEALITRILDDDLCSFDQQLQRHRMLIGERIDNHEGVFIAQSRGSLLLAGPSGSGKSSMASALLEQLVEQKYQFCLIDPEGDYDGLPDTIMIGTPADAPNVSEIEKALEAPSRNVVVNLLAIPLADRPQFFAALLPRLIEMRTASARPHWIIVDEAHHLLPASWVPAPAVLPQSLGGMMLITVHPTYVSEAALQSIDTLIAIGNEGAKTIRDFAEAIDVKVPAGLPTAEIPTGHATVWLRTSGDSVAVVKTKKGTFERRRHIRKYAEGELPENRSFYFRGPKGALNLRAQNLNLFVQLADGVDDETWLYHLKRGEYSKWMRWAIKDDELVADVESVEKDFHDAAESKRRIREAIESRYTAAA